MNTTVNELPHFINDKLHRQDGPALVNYLCRKGVNYWFFNGLIIPNCSTQEYFNKAIKLLVFL